MALRKRFAKKKRSLKERAEEIIRTNPQYRGLIEEARKRGKLEEVVRAIDSGKLKVKKDIKEYKFADLLYHAVLSKSGVMKKIKKQGLKASVPSEYKSWGDSQPAIYFFGKVDEKYLYKGKSPFSGRVYSTFFRGRRTEAPHEEAVQYVVDVRGKLRRESAKEKRDVKIFEKEVGIVSVDAEKLAKHGIKLYPDPEIKGSYVLVDEKTGKLVERLPPELLGFVVEVDREALLKKVEPIAEEKAKKQFEEEKKNPFTAELASSKDYYEHLKKEQMGLEARREVEKELRKKMDEEFIRRIIEYEKEKPLKRKKRE